MNNAEYLRDRRKKRRIECIKILGEKCTQCGSKESLEFDHIDPSTKAFTITTMLAGNWDNLLIEVKKCQLLCSVCHRNKSSKESFGRQFGIGRHGTMWMYWKHKCRCEICKNYKHQHYMKNKK